MLVVKISCIRETLNLLTNADSSTNTKTKKNGKKLEGGQVGSPKKLFFSGGGVQQDCILGSIIKTILTTFFQEN